MKGLCTDFVVSRQPVIVLVHTNTITCLPFPAPVSFMDAIYIIIMSTSLASQTLCRKAQYFFRFACHDRP